MHKSHIGCTRVRTDDEQMLAGNTRERRSQNHWIRGERRREREQNKSGETEGGMQWEVGAIKKHTRHGKSQS